MTITTSKDPIAVFNKWFAEAEAAEPVNPNAMTLATCTVDGRPSARMVLLKDVTDRGFTFYTNLTSRKGTELAKNPLAALCFYWKTLARQVSIEGPVEAVDDAEADEYFASRSRMSRIGAWASKQSRPMTGRFELEKRVAEYTAKFHVGAVPRPSFWSGFRVVPKTIEFWQEHQFRLHQRVLYTRAVEGWRMETLYP